jgi:hypothetical protein
MEDKGLGRRIPSDFSHITKYPFSAVAGETLEKVEKTLILPSWIAKHNQGSTSSCVGHSTSMMLSILNEHQCRRQGEMNPYIRYNPYWIWRQAKDVDEWPETTSNPDDNNGTSVKAAISVLIDKGHVLWYPNEDDVNSFTGPEKEYGVSAVKWAQNVDEMRTAISQNTPMAIGINWYNNFNTPEYINAEYWIGKSNFGRVIGGHGVCIFACSDERQAFKICNNWGPTYPQVWLSYDNMDRLIREQGEVALCVDYMV